MIRTLTLAALAAVLVAPAARAQQPQQRRQPQQQPQQGTASRAAVNDSLFAAAAATGGMAELSLSELGVQRATDPELKRFSQRMIDEHTRMNQELMTLAAQRGLPVPRTVDARAQFCAESLAGLTGEEFDKCYAKAQLVTHLDAVGTFEAEAERGMDPQMKALAARALPHIKEHLKMIKPIAMRYHEQEEKQEKEHQGERENK